MVYPNPVRSTFSISGLAHTERLTICTPDGRQVHCQDVDAATRVDVSALPAGLYIVNIEGKNLKMMKL